LTQKKSYSRYFIILQEDEKGYALGSDKLPSGYAKLEIKNEKCKISYYVQNLKKESSPYFMVLICNKKDVKKIIRIGELNIDEHGRTEVSYEYPVENVANCSIGVDKVVGAAIVRFMNSNVISVMNGFTSTEIPEWKSFDVIEDESKTYDLDHDKKDELRPIVLEEAKENIFDEYELKIEEVKKTEETKVDEESPRDSKEAMVKEECPQDVEETEVEEKYPGDSEEEIKEIELLPIEEEQIEVDSEIDGEEYKAVLNEDEYYNGEDLRHKKKSTQEKCEVKIEVEYEEKKEYEVRKEDYYKGSMGTFFKNLILDYEELEGYCQEIKRCKWYRVPVSKPEDMHSCQDYNKHTVVYYPMLNYYPYIGKHKHFILGYKFDKDNNMKYIVYGVPGRRARMDQPFGGKSGFVTWVPLIPGEEEENNMGYWLMFYDFNNSTIVIPVR
jgi:hypothetical protein